MILNKETQNRCYPNANWIEIQNSKMKFQFLFQKNVQTLTIRKNGEKKSFFRYLMNQKKCISKNIYGKIQKSK